MRVAVAFWCLPVAACRFGFDAGTVDDAAVDDAVVYDAAAIVWYDPAWSYRKKLTIDHKKVGAGGVTSFPLAVAIDDPDLAAGARADGFDIVFTAADGVSMRPHEIERYASGSLSAWVNVPSLAASTDTDVFMYYGNPASTDQQATVGVWDANYVAVYHLDETVGGSDAIRDSTANANHATNRLAVTLGSAGKIGNAIAFASGGYLDTANTASLDGVTTAITIDAWIKLAVPTTSMAEFPCIVHRWFGGNGGFGLFFSTTGTTGSDDVGIHTADGTDQDYLYATPTWTVGAWYQMVGTWSPTPGVMANYRDGTLINSASSTNAAIVPVPIGVYIGGDPGSLNTLIGMIDEVRISKVARSAAWIETQFNNQSSATFFSLSPQQTP